MHTESVIGFIHTMEQFATTVTRLYAKLSRYESDHFFGALSREDLASFEREAASAVISLRYLVERLDGFMTSEKADEHEHNKAN